MARAGYPSWSLPFQSILNESRIQSLSRPFDNFTFIRTSINSVVQPSAKYVINGLAHRLEGVLSSLSTQQDDRLDQETFADSRPLRTSSQNTLLITPTANLDFQNPSASTGRSTGHDAISDNTLHRRRTLSLNASPSGPSTASMGRSWSLAGTIQAAGLWRRDDKLEYPDPLTEDFESDYDENDESRDDFDTSISLALPFQLLLVNSQFANAAVQSLWRNIVFHGHDTYQMQSLLSTLSMDDGPLDPHEQQQPQQQYHGTPSLDKLKEDEDEDEVTKDERVDNLPDTFRNCHAVEQEDNNTGPAGNNKNDYPPKYYGSSEQSSSSSSSSILTTNLDHETNPWNNSLKQFSRFQGVNNGQNKENTEVPSKEVLTQVAGSSSSRATATASILNNNNHNYNNQSSRMLVQRRHTSSSSNSKYKNSYQLFGASNETPLRSNRTRLSKARPREPRWLYRRHVRRVVLNFAHPQASPQMFLKVLECLRTRCPNQITALDLHANEKMRDSGLDNPEALGRYFSSGFSKLRYLRLQGGFVDNQLLCALIKGFGSAEPLPSEEKESVDGSRQYQHSRHSSFASVDSTFSPIHCRLSHVFLGPGSITDSAVEKLIAAAGHCLEVFTVTSCVDVGGNALANLLTSCPKLRVLGVHRSLARDKDLLEGLGIEMDNLSTAATGPATGSIHAQTNYQLFAGGYVGGGGVTSNSTTNYQSSQQPRRTKKAIIAPLQRLELGTVKLTKVGITEIIKGTCETLRFLVLETQHFSEDLLTDVIAPFCSKLEGLYFDDPEYLQRQQQQMQGLGFSAGRRGAHLPNRHFEFGRSKRSFYSDPTRQYQQTSPLQQTSGSQRQQQQQQHQQQQSQFLGSASMERQNSSSMMTRPSPAPKISAWLGETSTDEWVTYGDCALWTNAASPAISFENGGADTGSQRLNNQHPRRQPPPLHNAYHNDIYMRGLTQSSSGSSSTSGAGMNIGNNNNGLFIREYEEVLEQFRVGRWTIENVIQTLRSSLTAFTVMQIDFIEESQGQSELKMLMRHEENWVQ
ncbi:hypothetical protein BGZ46_002908, partial [Entomortierella lignicola]